MRDRLDAERIMLVAEKASEGVIGAHRVLQEMIDRNDRMEAERRFGQPKASPPAAADRPGKKAMAEAAAGDAEADLIAELERQAAGHVIQ